MSEYILTVKFVSPGTTHVDFEEGTISKSSVGHVWLEVRERGQSLDSKPLFSTGWNMGRDKTLAGIDNHSKTDWADYRESPDHHINSISIGISRDQFAKLQAYPDLAATGKIAGFRSVEAPRNGVLGLDGIPGRPSNRHNDTAYNLLANSCVDYSGQGLAHIGLAGKNFDGNPLLMPDRQIKDFLDEMAKHNQSGISVRYEGKTHVLQPGGNVNRFWDTVAPNWEYVPYYLQNGNPDIRETQYARTFPTLTIDNIPEKARELYIQTEERMRAFHKEFDIPYQEHELKNAAAALAAVAYEKKLPEVQDFELHNGRMVAFWESKGGVYKEALLDAGLANSMPRQESFARMIETEPKLEEAARQRAMEIAAYEQSQNMGRSMA